MRYLGADPPLQTKNKTKTKQKQKTKGNYFLPENKSCLNTMGNLEFHPVQDQTIEKLDYIVTA